jgi:hypothetical protein
MKESQTQEIDPEVLTLGARQLAAFGAMVLKAHRDPDPADVDGGTLQDLAVKAGVLEARQVTEPCGESCMCAEVGQIPGECFFQSEASHQAYLSLSKSGLI